MRMVRGAVILTTLVGTCKLTQQLPFEYESDSPF